MDVIPLPYFGHRYESSGDFTYYSEFASRLVKKYYVVSADGSDPEVFWPLVTHELAHCWLSRTDQAERIFWQHFATLSGIGREDGTSQIEEALCDGLATKIMGPSYPFSFLGKFWAGLQLESGPTHPSNQLRLEIMARILETDSFSQEAEEIRETTERTFGTQSWKQDVISGTLDDIGKVVGNVQLTGASSALRGNLLSEVFEIDKSNHVTNGGIKLSCSESSICQMFQAVWKTLSGGSAADTSKFLREASDEVVRWLNNVPTPANAQT